MLLFVISSIFIFIRRIIRFIGIIGIVLICRIGFLCIGIRGFQLFILVIGRGIVRFLCILDITQVLILIRVNSTSDPEFDTKSIYFQPMHIRFRILNYKAEHNRYRYRWEH